MFPGCTLGPRGKPLLEKGQAAFLSAIVYCFPSDDMTGMWLISLQHSLELMKGEAQQAVQDNKKPIRRLTNSLKLSVVRRPLAGKSRGLQVSFLRWLRRGGWVINPSHHFPKTRAYGRPKEGRWLSEKWLSQNIGVEMAKFSKIQSVSENNSGEGKRKIIVPDQL